MIRPLRLQKKYFIFSGPAFTPSLPLLGVGPLVEELFFRLPLYYDFIICIFLKSVKNDLGNALDNINDDITMN